MVTITEVARGQILRLMQSQASQGLALRFGVRGRGPGGFQYRLAFVDMAERTPDDQAIEQDGLTVLIDAQSVPLVQGSTIDYVEEHGAGGFKIDNPNPLWSDPVAVAVQRVLDDEINPAVASHGGFVSLIDVREGMVFIQLGGGCQGCGMVDVTLKHGIEARIREVIPEIVSVVDTTEHAEGRNPYYQPAKGGRSPFGA
jgi:Fe/S biogenesis protein NfuA